MIVGMNPTEAAEAALAADRAHDDPAIWITRLPDAAVLARARALEAEGPQGRPLWGVPFAVKDNIDVAGLPTTAACPDYARIAETTAPAVQRLLDAGAVLDRQDQPRSVRHRPGRHPQSLRHAAQRVRRRAGPGRIVVRLRRALSPPGSCRFALGTDTAGSGRVPAAFGNIVGLKPTIGSVSARGMVPACRSLDTISVFARTVDEATARAACYRRLRCSRSVFPPRAVPASAAWRGPARRAHRRRRRRRVCATPKPPR